MKHFETENQLINICFIQKFADQILEDYQRSTPLGATEEKVIEIAKKFNKRYPDSTNWENEPSDFESTCYRFTELSILRYL